MTEEGLSQEELENLVEKYEWAKRIVRNMYFFNKVNPYFSNSDSDLQAMVQHLLGEGKSEVSREFDFSKLEKWKTYGESVSSRNGEMAKRVFSPEEQEIQNIKGEFARAIAGALHAQGYGCPLLSDRRQLFSRSLHKLDGEKYLLPQNPELRSMVETLLSPMVSKSRGYSRSSHEVTWEMQEQGVHRNGKFRISLRSVNIEGLLEIKDYPADLIHLSSKTLGIHEMIFQKTLRNSSFDRLLEEVIDQLKQHGCSEENLQTHQFRQGLEKDYWSNRDFSDE